jgi:uncharacterized membrane protein HdeD (DUF308 family)
MLLVAGLFQLIHGFTAKEEKWVGALAYFAHAVLYILMGGFILWNPVAASAGLTVQLRSVSPAEPGATINWNAHHFYQRLWGSRC